LPRAVAWSRAVAISGLALLVAACGSLVVDPGSSVARTKGPYTKAPPTPAFSPLATVGPGSPGQPYAAADIEPMLAAASVGVAAEIRTPQVAAAIADRIWTFDGRPYQEVFIGGSCENGGCEIVVEGVPAFAPTRDTRDVWSLSLDLRTGVFSDSEPALGGFPAELTSGLDALARSLDADGTFRTLPLTRVEWLRPPPDGLWLLRYGSGTQEMDVNWYVTISTVERRILSVRSQVM
jgi:hypothetical protein